MALNQEQLKVKRRDIFQDAPLPVGFYHPSPPRGLSSKEKETLLSPQRIKDALDKAGIEEHDQFLKGSHVYSRKTMPTSEHSPQSNASKFDESWPDSERPSSLSIPEVEEQYYLPTELSKVKFGSSGHHHDYLQMVPERDRQKEKVMITERSKVKPSDSTLSRYIHQFRFGEPMSREERAKKQGAGGRDFWWMSESASPHSASDVKTSTPRTDDTPPASRPPKQSSTRRDNKISMATGDEEDRETRLLQERADALLERTSSSVNSDDPVVSTDGLGSSSSILSYDEPQTVTPKPVYSKLIRGKENLPKFSLADTTHHEHQSSSRMAKVKGQGADSDILYQWRLKRKLETARTAAKAVSTDPSSYLQSRTPVEDASSNRKMQSKLEEFHERLRGMSTPAQSSSVQFAPAPSDYDLQTNKVKHEEAPQAQHVRCEDLVAPQSVVPICSPHVRRRHDDNVHPPPHLHLMCDILPCTHQPQHKLTANQQAGNQCVQDDAVTTEMTKNANDGGEHHRNHHHGDIDIPVRDSTQPSMSNQERILVDTENRIGDSSKRSEVESRIQESRTRVVHESSDTCVKDKSDQKAESKHKSAQSENKIRDNQTPKMSDSENVSSSESRKESGTDSKENIEGCRRRGEQTDVTVKSKHERKSKTAEHLEKVREANDQTESCQEPKNARTTEQRKTGHPGQDHDIRQGLTEKPLKDKSRKPKSSGKSRGMRYDSASTTSTAAPPSVRHEKRAPRPVSASSPKSHRKVPSTINTAIGQVVNDRLFGAHQMSPLSSVESLPHSLVSKVTSEQEYSSSDDEFREDEILQLLRQQKARYEAQLYQIDSMLQEIT